MVQARCLYWMWACSTDWDRERWKENFTPTCLNLFHLVVPGPQHPYHRFFLVSHFHPTFRKKLLIEMLSKEPSTFLSLCFFRGSKLLVVVRTRLLMSEPICNATADGSGASSSLMFDTCVLLCFIKSLLGNRYVRSRGFIVSEPREMHPRSEITDVPTSPCPPFHNLGCPDPYPPP